MLTLRQSANSSTTRLVNIFGTLLSNKRKNYGLLRTKAQKRHKSVKKKALWKGRIVLVLACDATYEVIEDLLNVPIRFIVWIFYSLTSYDILEAKLKLTPAKNGFCNEVFEASVKKYN